MNFGYELINLGIGSCTCANDIVCLDQHTENINQKRESRVRGGGRGMYMYMYICMCKREGERGCVRKDF